MTRLQGLEELPTLQSREPKFVPILHFAIFFLKISPTKLLFSPYLFRLIYPIEDRVALHPRLPRLLHQLTSEISFSLSPENPSWKQSWKSTIVSVRLFDLYWPKKKISLLVTRTLTKNVLFATFRTPNFLSRDSGQAGKLLENKQAHKSPAMNLWKHENIDK